MLNVNVFKVFHTENGPMSFILCIEHNTDTFVECNSDSNERWIEANYGSTFYNMLIVITYWYLRDCPVIISTS